jgi:hypothetical protein
MSMLPLHSRCRQGLQPSQYPLSLFILTYSEGCRQGLHSFLLFSQGLKRGTFSGHHFTTSLALQTRAATFRASTQSRVELPRSILGVYGAFTLPHTSLVTPRFNRTCFSGITSCQYSHWFYYKHCYFTC